MNNTKYNTYVRKLISHVAKKPEYWYLAYPSEELPDESCYALLSESLKNTYERVIPFYDFEIKKNLENGKNILISAHGNSLRALCKYLFNISDTKINELEIPTGNPLVIEFDNKLNIQKYFYLDDSRAKKIIFSE